MPNVVRTTLLLSALCTAMLHWFRASVIQVLSDTEHIDHITQICSFPGHEIFVKNTSACCYKDLVDLRISPETEGCSWRPLVYQHVSVSMWFPAQLGDWDISLWLGH